MVEYGYWYGHSDYVLYLHRQLNYNNPDNVFNKKLFDQFVSSKRVVALARPMYANRPRRRKVFSTTETISQRCPFL